MLDAIETALRALVTAALAPDEPDDPAIEVLLNDPRIDDMPEGEGAEALRAAITTGKPEILDTLSGPTGPLYEIDQTFVIAFQAMGQGGQTRVRAAAALTAAALAADPRLSGAASWARIVESGGHRDRINGAPDDAQHEIMVKVLFYAPDGAGI